MKTSILAIAAMVCLAGLTGCQLPAAEAADGRAAMQMERSGSESTRQGPAEGHSTQPLAGGEAMFQTIQKLAGGRWEARLPDDRTIVDTFQPFASGTYILGEEWIDGKQITSTVFYMVGSQLWADHFCDYGNQPRYTARPSGDASVVNLVFRDATDLDTHPRHFHSTVWHLIDATHMTQDWQVIGGPKAKITVHLDFVRKGSSA